MPRVLPHSNDAEKAVLGGIITFSSVGMREAMDHDLQPDEFYYENHRRIYEVMQEMHNANQVVDIQTLTAKLDDKNILNALGGSQFLFELTEQAISSASLKHHIELIQRKAQQRRLYDVATKISEDASNSDVDLDDLFSDSENAILNVTRSRKTEDFKVGAEVADDVYKHIVDLSTLETKVVGLKTGYHQFDGMTNGLHGGDLIILAARPAVGKSAFALNLALQVSKRNDNCTIAIFSLEMGADQLMGRLLANEARVPSNKLSNGKLESEEWSSLSNAVNTIKTRQLYFDDTSTIKVSEIFAKCRKLKADAGLDLVIIDYLQLITGRGRATDNRQVEVSEISRSLKQLAREMDCPVIALSQLSRSVEQRKGEPMLSDLRESGSIEQDADMVMFLHRDYYDYDKKKEDGEGGFDENSDFTPVKVIIAKHRNGATGSFELGFERSISRFSNMDYKEN